MAQIVNAQFYGGPVTITGAVTASVVEINIAQIPLSQSTPNGMGIYAEFVLMLKDSSNNFAATRAARSFKRISSSLTVLGGAITSIVAVTGDAALSTAVAVLDASGDTIRARVTGIAATTIECSGILTISSSPWAG